jgi:hypothetical protein
LDVWTSAAGRPQPRRARGVDRGDAELDQVHTSGRVAIAAVASAMATIAAAPSPTTGAAIEGGGGARRRAVAVGALAYYGAAGAAVVEVPAGWRAEVGSRSSPARGGVERPNA